MNNLAIVFDTNAYRDLCDIVLPTGIWSVGMIATKERQKQILSCANPYVIMELASHLWDENDPAYGECRCALTSLYQHCCTDAGDQVRVVADAESQVAIALYQKEPPGHAETTERLSKLACAVAIASTGTFAPKIRDACKEISDQITSREDLFVKDIQAVVLAMNPAAAGWDPYAKDKPGRQQALATVSSDLMRWRIALAHVLKARDMLGIPRNEPELKEMTDDILAHTGTAVALYQEILVRLVSTGCDVSKKKRANWIWDMEIALGVGEEIGDPPKKIVLVTGDGAVVEAAKAADAGAYVMSLNDYLAGLYV